jgi:GT2 family glycosyltransferase
MAPRLHDTLTSDKSYPLDLSILIVNWNSRDYLLEAICAVKSALVGCTYEIVVIDSGSFDGSSAAIAATHPDIKFVQATENLGFARANNAAFQHAVGQYLLFLNPDTEVRPNAIQTLFDHLVSSRQIGIVGPKLLNSDGSIQETCIRAFPTLLNQVLESDGLRRLFPNSRLWGMGGLTSNVPIEVEAVSGACLMMRRDLFEQIGMFSGEYFMYSEDIDLCFKVKQLGFSIHYVPQAIVVHHGGGSTAQTTKNTFGAVMMLESRWRYFKKTRSTNYALVYRVAMFMVSLIRVALLLLALPLAAIFGQAQRVNAALGKWSARSRWALGL